MKVGEIIQSEKFDEFLHIQLGLIEQKKENAHKEIEKYHGDLRISGEKIKLKRDEITCLEEKGLLTKKSLIDEFEKILFKTSDLPHRERKFIYDLMYNCMLQTVTFWEKEKEGHAI